MSKIDNNHLVKGARGNFSKQFVYKKRGSDTHISRMPVVKVNKELTEKQEGVREMFLEAVNYAKGAMLSPELKREYQKKASDKNTAYNVAFRDYTKPPVVKSIDTEKYNGTPGSTIVVSARDDFRVTEVTVRIRTGAGAVLEEGNAVLNPLNHNKWIYTATQNNATVNDCTITAKDLPGNKGELEVSL